MNSKESIQVIEFSITKELLVILDELKGSQDYNRELLSEQYSEDYKDFLLTDEMGKFYKLANITKNFRALVRSTIKREVLNNTRLYNYHHSSESIFTFKHFK